VKREIETLPGPKETQGNLQHGAHRVLGLPMETSKKVPPLWQQFPPQCRTEKARGGKLFLRWPQSWPQAGIPSVVFGPGDIAYAHTGSEWISLRSLERAVPKCLSDF